MASASLLATPAAIARPLEPSRSVSSRSTLAPAPAARSPVPSLDPSSTTITSRVYAQPRQAWTTTATVGASLRAGTIASIFMVDKSYSRRK